MSAVTEEYIARMFTRLRDEVLPMTAGSEPLVEYTVVINQENSNCKTACTYADDAASMSKGSHAWDLKPIFKDIKPCVFSNGAVAYYLNPNDWTKKADGTAADLTGIDGDVMIEVPKFAYRIYTGDNNMLYVSVTNDPDKVIADNRYSYDAFSRAIIGDLNHFYIGAFPGYVDNNNKLRSIAGVKPTGSKTIAEFNTYAQENGAHYQQLRYPQLKALQCLYLIKYGNRNGQEALGYGNVSGLRNTLVNGYDTTSVESISTAANTFTKGMCFGNKSLKTKHMRFLGIEDFWGNICQWVKCLTTDANRAIIYLWSEDNGENVEADPVTISSDYTSNFGSYPRYTQGTTDAGFMPRTTNTGSSSTYWPDGAYLYPSCVLYFGDMYGGNLNAGPFCLYATYSASGTHDAFGARLQYL